ncbi:conserved hypothetical protein [Gammaproteobacteria bacterium]
MIKAQKSFARSQNLLAKLADEAMTEDHTGKTEALDPGSPRVFAGSTYTFEDDRFSYGEQRFITLGLLAGTPVSVAHTETKHEIRVISFRKATHREAQIYFNEIKN